MELPREWELLLILRKAVAEELAGGDDAIQQYQADNEFRITVNRATRAAVRCFREYCYTWDKPIVTVPKKKESA